MWVAALKKLSKVNNILSNDHFLVMMSVGNNATIWPVYVRRGTGRFLFLQILSKLSKLF